MDSLMGDFGSVRELRFCGEDFCDFRGGVFGVVFVFIGDFFDLRRVDRRFFGVFAIDLVDNYHKTLINDLKQSKQLQNDNN